jgi:hypothetical protein
MNVSVINVVVVNVENVAVVTVVLPEAAGALLVLSVASTKETTGGVTTANQPHVFQKRTSVGLQPIVAISSIV